MIRFWCLVSCLILANSLAFADPIVTLPNGRIRGHHLTTGKNKTFYGFQGIPYASPPLGNLRFQAPVAAQNWEEIFDATQDGADCINKYSQNDNKKSEDCLFINVYTPKLNTTGPSDERLPVMFWIYGGGFDSGTSTYSMYGPDYLIQEDVVFVSFNYRLGAFGFLSTGDAVIPGNAGLKDQNLALKWTYQNIHLFGGDPEKITIFGESAGSASVVYQLLSDKSAGLFRAAIGASGTALGSWAFNPNPKQYARQLLYNVAKNNHLVIDNSTLTNLKLLQILRIQTTESIVEASNQIGEGTVPCLEVSHQHAFLTESSFELLRNGIFSRVPLMFGMNSEEYLILMGNLRNLASRARLFDENIENLIPESLVLSNSTNKTEVAQLIKGIYLNNNDLFADNLGAALKYGSDDMMTRPIIKHASLQSRFSDVYFYQFSYHGMLGMMQNFSIDDDSVGKVGHAEEMPYLFKMIHESGVNTSDLSKFSEQDNLVAKQMVTLWTNFAKYLNPTPKPSKLLQNISWPVLNHCDFQYLDIGEDLRVIEEYPRENSFHQWNDIFYTYGVKPFYVF